MKCAYLIPSANPQQCGSCFAAWREMGWDTYAITDTAKDIDNANRVFFATSYLGWGESFNFMARALAGKYDWLATGGDDVWPDPNVYAEEIGRQCTEHFAGTDGICQPIGDAWAFDKNGTAEPIAFAPIIGAGFAAKGAFWPGYHHYFADADLYQTASRNGKLWLRDDLLFDHRHVAKAGRPVPPYMAKVQQHWQADHDLYEQRKRDGFPGAVVLP